MALAPGKQTPGAANIGAAQRRSVDYGIDPTTTDIPDVGSPGPAADALRRLSSPVLARLLERLTDSSFGVVLADRAGRLTKRDAATGATLAVMDERSLDVGYSLAEADVGTNGVGTSLETKRPAMVVGSEHFLDCFASFTCANAPIIHPISHKVEGTVGVLCPVEDTTPLLLPTAIELSARISELLLEMATPEERFLLEQFLVRRRHAHTAVATIGKDALIATPAAQRLLSGVDHAELWTTIQGEVHRGRSFDAEFQRPSGTPLLLRCQPLVRGGAIDGAAVEIVVAPSAGGGGRTVGPGHGLGTLVGTSDQWRTVVRDAFVAAPLAEPILIVGERGTGRRSVAIALAGLMTARTVPIFDSAALLIEGEREWLLRVRTALRSEPVVILPRVDQLPGDVAAALGTLLADPDGARVIATSQVTASTDPGRAALLDQLNVIQIETPPLRSRRGDIAPLATRFAAQLGRGTPDEPVLHVLHRQPWPGNATELRQVLRSAHARARTQPLAVEHLPRHLRRVPNRTPLHGLQQQEADAIVAAIAATTTRAEAAERLGISRATLFRRIRDYGIDLDGG